MLKKGELKPFFYFMEIVPFVVLVSGLKNKCTYFGYRLLFLFVLMTMVDTTLVPVRNSSSLAVT